jgi:hypothetical protein
MTEYRLVATTFKENRKYKIKRKNLGTFATLEEARQELDKNIEKWKVDLKELFNVDIQLWVDGKRKEIQIGYEADLYE